MPRLRRPAPATIVSLIALFVALGGTSYAAIKIPRNAVTTKQVKDRSLRAKDFKRGQLPSGPRGVRGPTGAPGPTGTAGTAGAKGDTGAVGPAGATGQTGPQGPTGANAATFVRFPNTAPASLPAASQVQLTPGKWLLQATLTTTATGATAATCALGTGTPFSLPGGESGFATASIDVVATTSPAGLTCGTPGDVTDVRGLVTAIRLGDA